MIVLFSLSAGTVSNPAFSLPDEPPVPIVVIEDYAAVAADVGAVPTSQVSVATHHLGESLRRQPDIPQDLLPKAHRNHAPWQGGIVLDVILVLMPPNRPHFMAEASLCRFLHCALSRASKPKSQHHWSISRRRSCRR